MKKTIQYAYILLLFILLCSCRKKYSCNCVTTIIYSGIIPTQDVINSGTKTYSEKMTEKQAKSACDHQGETINSTFNDNFKQGANGTATAKTVCSIQ